MKPSFNRLADQLIIKGRYAEAQVLLDAAIQAMPAGWTPRQEDKRFVRIAFWDQEEFLAHGHRVIGMNRLTKSIVWVEGSYSRAWYQLAVVASKQGRFEHALFCLDRGLELEPDHPELWNEKGYVLGRLNSHREAFDCYVRAVAVRDWAPSSQIARALRGQGVQLVDLERLDEAEDALRRSLDLDPDSEIAHNELGHIENLRNEKDDEEETIPWFLHSFVNPPADPLTVRLLALVEDLPPIPGPKTVGSENYSRILEAFLKRGWAGFEEEFDRIVPRGRPNYADMKRDMLCEPMFSMKAHRNMADAVLGNKTVEEIFAATEQQRKRKPQ
ncbi:MAG: tetratricopeptide repeat protein [Bryobacterales bacterium]|nr:tetratricopeptide repeat protein [Bryobacterales bacterium]